MNAWDAICRAAAAPHAAFQMALANPNRAQTDLLLHIVARNAQTRFGREHGFADIATVEDFRRATPIGDYAAFRAAIAEVAAGADDILTRDPTVVFEETGGTSSGRKLIPYTSASLASFRAAVLPWLANLAQRRPGVAAGRVYVTISPVARAPRLTLGGIPIGLRSEAAYLGDDLAAALLPLLAVPLEVAGFQDVAQWRLETLAHLVECEDLSFVSVWSPTFFVELIRALPLCADEIRRRSSPAARSRLARALGQRRFDTAPLWPRLDTISCWADGGSASLARQLAGLCPQATIEPKGLLATEAAITTPWNGGVGSMPALTSTFIEFIGRDGEARMAHELDEGEDYRILVTTWGGLSRYEMGDLVRCLGYEGAAPRLVFLGREGLVSDMVGEKLDEAFVVGVLSRLSFAAALVPCRTPRPHYEIWLDDEATPLDAVAREVERGLSENPQYSYARAIGQLGACVPLSRPGYIAARNAARTLAGARIGDLKSTALILDEA